MVSQTDEYWFPAKRYGWGWGLPIRWQGWIVMIVYVALLALDAYAFLRAQHLVMFFVVAVLLNFILVLICWLKGEPPRWRWGKN